MTTSARPVAPDWGLALGISSAGFAARAFTGDRRSLEGVRRFTREVLSAWGLTALTDDMTTVVSELVTNALRHALEGREQAPGKAWIGMLRTGGALVCAVADPDPSPRCPRLQTLSRKTGGACASWTPSPASGATARPTATGRPYGRGSLYLRREARPGPGGPEGIAAFTRGAPQRRRARGVTQRLQGLGAVEDSGRLARNPFRKPALGRSQGGR
ncbi:ATP-binding protein [Streptomyces sp. GMR22]|uniref:ATP-binding protein n=1 Tax=Streptomyces sp. GMR22 TaxID=2759524 RepID=UPI003FA34FD8